MRIAAVSDIHSNVFALAAVLADIRKRGADICVNLGDILYGPISPKATYQLLMEHDLVTIRGNQDRQIYEASATDINNNPTMAFILQDLGQQPLQWMRQLPFDLQLTDDVYLCHGTPTNDLVYLLEDVSSGQAMLRSDAEITTLLADISSPLIMCGHTHTARTVMTSTQQLIVNPGSVGLPAYSDDEPVPHSMQSLSPHASYAIVESTTNGWTVEQIRIAYDFHQAAKEASKRNRMDWVHFLTTGTRLPTV